jgi:hypothetical protein
MAGTSFIMKVTSSTRRQFIKTAATAVTAFQILPRHVLGGARFVPPSEKVNVAVVGVGGRGTQNMKALLALDDVQVIAVADPAESFGLEDFTTKGSVDGFPRSRWPRSTTRRRRRISAARRTRISG